MSLGTTIYKVNSLYGRVPAGVLKSRILGNLSRVTHAPSAPEEVLKPLDPKALKWGAGLTQKS